MVSDIDKALGDLNEADANDDAALADALTGVLRVFLVDVRRIANALEKIAAK
jgi:hypothetical protein